MFNVSSDAAGSTPEGYLAPTLESAGVPEGLKDYVIVIPWNDIGALERAFESDGDDIAAVIMEPIAYNAGGLLADKEYMEQVRELTTLKGAVLIYDEVISGLRNSPGGAQDYYGVVPDMCFMAKAIGNGIALAVVAGKQEFMETVGQGVAQSGTYTSHLFGVLSGLATIAEVRKPGFYENLLGTADKFYDMLRDAFARHGVPAWVQGVGSRGGIFFGMSEPVRDYRDTGRIDIELAGRFYRGCFEEGMYFHQFGGSVRAGLHGVCASHTAADIDIAAEKVDRVLDRMKREA